MYKIDFESQKLAFFCQLISEFWLKRYENELRIIFDQWPKLSSGLDVRPDIPILKGL